MINKVKNMFNFKFDHNCIELCGGVSLTNPDMSYSVRELLEKFTNGVIPPVARTTNFEENPTFEDYDQTRELDFDLADATEMSLAITARQKELRRSIKEKEDQKAKTQKAKMAKWEKWEKDHMGEEKTDPPQIKKKESDLFKANN